MFNKLRLLLPIMLFSANLHAQLKINELMTNNVSACMDDHYNYSMWVEIYNAGTTSIDLYHAYFTDDADNPQKWQYPESLTIPAGECAVVWFERPENNAHSSFKLEPEGGVLYLYDANGTLYDQVSYPPQYRNVSCGRYPDGSDSWRYFEEFSPAKTNQNKKSASEVCAAPQFTLSGGFYASTQSVAFETPSFGDSIFYTLNGDEPTRYNSVYYVPESQLLLRSTTVIRAIAFAANKLPSKVVSNTYFIGYRNITLPVVSIVTSPANLWDNQIGIYVEGTNGISGNGTDKPMNWNQDWDRPANFELYDQTKTQVLNQELDIGIIGGWTRTLMPSKSLKIQPRKKFGSNRLRYDFFSTKPNRKYKDIQIRNSGNDFPSTMMRDALMQSLIIDRMDVDYTAYEPAVCFFNGEYRGILNLRERSSKDYLYSNCDLDEDEFILSEASNIANNQQYTDFINYLRENNVTNRYIYNDIANKLDIDSYVDYMIAETYFGNTDWPHNNYKIWKPIDGGKFRWILFDTDFGFGLNTQFDHNTLWYVLHDSDETITYPLRRLLSNTTFKQKFISRFCIHISSTFETQRVTDKIVSMSDKIKYEIPYHFARWNPDVQWINEVNKMKTFALNRPNKMLQYIGEYFFGTSQVHTINLTSNLDSITYSFNNEKIIDNEIALKYFHNQVFEVQASEKENYQFLYWESYDAQGSVLQYKNSVFNAALRTDISLHAVYAPIGNAIFMPAKSPQVTMNEAEKLFFVKYARNNELCIFDLSGRNLYSKTLSSENESINTSFLKCGVYLVKIYSHTFKIIIN